MKIGYVTRNNPKNNREHSILQATMYNFFNIFSDFWLYFTQTLKTIFENLSPCMQFLQVTESESFNT